MTTINAGIIVGGCIGAGLALLTYLLVGPGPSLATSVTRWETARTVAAREQDRVVARGDTSFTTRGRQRRFGPTGAALATLAVGLLRSKGVTFASSRQDLAITGQRLEQFVARKMSLGLIGFFAPVLLTGLALAAGASLSVAPPLLMSVLFSAAGFLHPDQQLRTKAEERRTAMREAIASYLDLVAMSLAGGRGIPEALPAAADIGSGWGFDLLADTIGRARYLNVPPWKALRDLGLDTGVPELVDLGAALLLVADDGGKVRRSLIARAASARQRQMAEAESSAAKADDSMQFALFVVFAGIFIFLLYPAVAVVVAL